MSFQTRMRRAPPIRFAKGPGHPGAGRLQVINQIFGEVHFGLSAKRTNASFTPETA